MTITIYSPGEKAEALKHMANWAGNTKLSNERAIANGAVELDSGSQKIIDIFSAAAGANTTVDTGNTDAEYDATDDAYTCDIVTGTTETATDTNGANTTADSAGHRIYINNSCYLLTATVNTATSGATASLLTSGGALITSTTSKISAYVFKFDNTPLLTAGETYRLEISGSGSTSQKGFNKTYPFNNTNVNFVYGSQDGIDSSLAWCIDSITVSTSVPYLDATLQSTTVTIPTTDDYIFVTPYLAEELSDDALTFDYSMDNESTWNTGNAINTWVDASGATNTGTMSIKLQLDTDDGSTTPKVKGWAVLTE